MRFRLEIDGQEHQVVAEPNGVVVLDGERFDTQVKRPAADRVTVQVNDKSYEVRVIDNTAETGAYLLELGGERIPVLVREVVKGGGAAPRPTGTPVRVAAGADSGPAGAKGTVAAGEARVAAIADDDGVRAPMPGKIVNVLVEEGETVEEGAPVLILEAMKMENELRAPKRGRVASVLVRKGDQAERGQLLIAIE